MCEAEDTWNKYHSVGARMKKEEKENEESKRNRYPTGTRVSYIGGVKCTESYDLVPGSTEMVEWLIDNPDRKEEIQANHLRWYGIEYNI